MELPNKNTYAPDEIAKAWDCTVKDILQYWREGKLHLCILIIPSFKNLDEIGTRIHWNQKLPYRPARIEKFDNDSSSVTGLSGAYYVEPREEKYINGDLYKEEKYKFDDQIALTPAYLVDKEGGYDKYYSCVQHDVYTYYVDNYREISVSDICITHDERIRFEQFCNEQSIDKSHKEETKPSR